MVRGLSFFPQKAEYLDTSTDKVSFIHLLYFGSTVSSQNAIIRPNLREMPRKRAKNVSNVRFDRISISRVCLAEIRIHGCFDSFGDKVFPHQSLRAVPVKVRRVVANSWKVNSG